MLCMFDLYCENFNLLTKFKNGQYETTFMTHNMMRYKIGVNTTIVFDSFGWSFLPSNLIGELRLLLDRPTEHLKTNSTVDSGNFT